MLNFDDIGDWAPELSSALRRHVTKAVQIRMVAAKSRYVEDARNLLLKLTLRDEIIDATIDWIRSQEIAGYHGSRLTDAEVVSVRARGLVPLKADSRRIRLERALSRHPKWSGVADQLDAAIQRHGEGGAAGHQVPNYNLPFGSNTRYTLSNVTFR
jgi:hypothetical protein